MFKKIIHGIKKRDLKALIHHNQYRSFSKAKIYQSTIHSLLECGELDFFIEKMPFGSSIYDKFLTSLDLFLLFLNVKLGIQPHHLKEIFIKIMDQNEYDCRVFYDPKYFQTEYRDGLFTDEFYRILLQKFSYNLHILQPYFKLRFKMPEKDWEQEDPTYRYYVAKGYLEESGMFDNVGTYSVLDSSYFFALKYVLEKILGTGIPITFIFETVTTHSNKKLIVWESLLEEVSFHDRFLYFKKGNKILS